jgi:polynucleotide 5'-hydroxyl-kinase GRC3/NOL9
MHYELSSETALVVRGPALIHLLKGNATVLGAPIDNQTLVVRADRQLPIETPSRADLDIILGEPGKVVEVKGSTIPDSWHSCASAIIEMNQGSVLIMGAPDSGKSTLATFLANKSLQNGITPRVVDGDIGQADIGPPTTVAGGVASRFISSLADLDPTSMVFVGHTSPSRVQSKLIHALRKTAGVKKEHLTIINTDGWVLDPEAVIYKVQLIETVQPDLVIGITRGDELQPILSRTKAPSMRIEPSNFVLERSQSARRDTRTAGYRRYLNGGKTLSFSTHKVRVSLPGEPTILQKKDSLDLRNLIAGLLDEQGYLLQIGVILSSDENALGVYSKPADSLHEIEIGYIRLSINGEELGYLDL